VKIIHIDDGNLVQGGPTKSKDVSPEMAMILEAARRIIGGEGTHSRQDRGADVSNSWRFHDETMLVRVWTRPIQRIVQRVELALTDADRQIVARLQIKQHGSPEDDTVGIARDTLRMAELGMKASENVATGCDASLHAVLHDMSRIATHDAAFLNGRSPTTPGLKVTHHVGTPWRDGRVVVHDHQDDDEEATPPTAFPMVIACSTTRWNRPDPNATLRMSGVSFEHHGAGIEDPVLHLRDLAKLRRFMEDDA
jgi:hypothetical protein